MTTCVHHDKYRHTRQFKGRDGFWKSKTTCDLCAAYRAGAEAMRARCAARIRELMAEWGTTGSYFEFGAQLHNAIDQLPLDAPEAKGNQHE